MDDLIARLRNDDDLSARIEAAEAITALKAKVEALENRPVVGFWYSLISAPDLTKFSAKRWPPAIRKGYTETPLVAKEA